MRPSGEPAWALPGSASPGKLLPHWQPSLSHMPFTCLFLASFLEKELWGSYLG